MVPTVNKLAPEKMNDQILREHIVNQLEDYAELSKDGDTISDIITITKLYHESLGTEDAYWNVARLRDHGNYTLGVLLTAVEASLGDSKQSEALKAIVRREMFALMDRNQAVIYERADLQEPGLAPRETHIDGQDELR